LQTIRINDKVVYEFKTYKNDLEHIKKIVTQLIDRCNSQGIQQNFSANSEILELAEKVKFTSYRLYTLQNYIKGEIK